ncbi:hypothetical protein SUDANB58_01321 [Streptomyces sp. enrichment culture]
MARTRRTSGTRRTDGTGRRSLPRDAGPAGGAGAVSATTGARGLAPTARAAQREQPFRAPGASDFAPTGRGVTVTCTRDGRTRAIGADHRVAAPPPGIPPGARTTWAPGCGACRRRDAFRARVPSPRRPAARVRKGRGRAWPGTWRGMPAPRDTLCRTNTRRSGHCA